MSTLQDAGFWSRFWSRLNGKTYLDKGSKSQPFDVYTTDSGSSVTPENSLKLSAVWACVRLRSEIIASLPLHLRDENKVIAKDHPLYSILHDSPNADMSAFEFWRSQIASMDLQGGAHSLILRDKSGRIVALEPLDSSCMMDKRLDDGSLEYEYTKGGKKEIFNEVDVFHLRGFSLDGRKGLSVIEYAAETMGFQFDANKTAQKDFANGLKAGGFLETGERSLTPEQREMMREALAKFSLPENAGKHLILEAGMKMSANVARFKPIDAQLLESRYFGIEEICRAFSVPPQLIGHTNKASSWASSLEQTNMGFLTYSLRPILVNIEQAISRKLLTPVERSKYKPKFSVDGLLRADSAARAGFYAQMLQNGVMSRNDVRELEDLPRVDGADDLTVQLNMTTVDQLGKNQNA